MKHTTFLALLAVVPSLAHAALDTARIEAATGLKGTLNKAEGVFKATVPRNA